MADILRIRVLDTVLRKNLVGLDHLAHEHLKLEDDAQVSIQMTTFEVQRALLMPSICWN